MASVVSGIEGLFEDNSDIDLTISGNTIDATGSGDTGSNAIRLLYQITNMNVQMLTVENNTITNATAQGLLVQTEDSARVDAVISGNTITGSAEEGVQLSTIMTSLFRIDFNDNTVSNNDDEMRLLSTGSSGMIALITSNDIINNGTAAGHQGLDVETRDSAEMVVDILNNDINDNEGSVC